ncbi:MAG: DUF6159 family protein [Anaerolineales bacterium]
MIDRLIQSWQLVKASWGVLLADKELLIFPILSSIAVFLLTIAFFVPFAMAGAFQQLLLGQLTSQPWLTWLMMFLFYLSQYFILIFSNSALVAAAGIRLEGGNPTVGDGFRLAFRRIGSIAGYAVVAATVGLVLKAISRNRNALGRLTAALLGVAWNIATFLVVPALVNEGIGPWAAIKRSASMLRQTWGEQIIGNLSISTIIGLAGLGVSILVLVPTGYLAAKVNVAFLIGGLLLLVPVFLLLGLLNTTLSGIYQAAVYSYATTGEAGTFFPPDLVQRAFRQGA